MVYLVGAGTGDSGLITVKGLKCIKNADVIIYDNLINPSLLAGVNPNCRLIYAGKIAGNHHMTQEKINDELVKYGRTLNVVRLKGGDPFIFGRGGEEAECLFKNNIPYEIIAGISSCYSAAEYSGIPVTYRGISSSFHVITGHEKKGSETINYKALAELDGTLVFLMGHAFAENISRRLIENGKDKDTKTAVISNGTTEHHTCVVGTLKNLPVLAGKVSSPAVIVIGEAVGLKRDWFKPDNIKILATGTEKMNKSLIQAGLNITQIPLIKIIPQNFDLFEKTNLNVFSHIAFTSAAGIDVFFDYLKKVRKDLRIFGNIKFAVVGRKTADTLEKHGIFADIIPEEHSGVCLAEKINKCKNLLLVRAQNSSDDLTNVLNKNNILYTDLKIYRTETDFAKKELLNLCEADMDYVIFSSGSAAKAFAELSNGTAKAKFISIGSGTTQVIEKNYGLKIYKTAPTADAEGIKKCIEEDVK